MDRTAQINQQELVDALRDLFVSGRKYESCKRTSCGETLEAARDAFIEADGAAETILRELGEVT